ncbi:MAG: M48 family metalloprotease [Nibricoccus sp.]
MPALKARFKWSDRRYRVWGGEMVMRELLWITGAGVFSFAYVAVGNALTLGTWRRSAGEHWSVRARALWPVRVASHTLGWFLPITAALCWWISARSTPWILLVVAALVSAIGVELGTLPMFREICPRLTVSALLRSAAIGLFFRFFYVSLLLIVAAIMPLQPGPAMGVIAALALAFQLTWSLAGWIWTARLLKFLVPGSSRIRTLVETASRQTGIACSRVWIMRSQAAQALALPATRELVFTERLLEIMPDDEVSAVCAHELAHINEPKSALIVRLLGALTWFPCIFILPLAHALGGAGVFLPLAFGAFAPRLFTAFSRKMERAADRASHPSSG